MNSIGIDRQNPFVALGVVSRELSYSKVIADRLIGDPDYLTRLSGRLTLPAPLQVSQVKTEVSIGKAGRLDIVAFEPNGRAIVIETKVNAQVDRAQQARYVKAARALYGDETLFLAYKLGPAILPTCEPEFRLLTSADVLADMPPDDQMGLRGMLQIFTAIETRLGEDPLGPRKRMKAGLGDGLDAFLFAYLSHSYYEFLFARFKAKVDSMLPGHSMQPNFAITQRGGKILQYYEPAWVKPELGVQVHFELKDNERMALHVETEPYPPKDPAHLVAKTGLAQRLQDDLRELVIPEMMINNLRKDVAKEGSTTIATVRLDFDDLDGSAAKFTAAYRRCAPIIDQLLV